MYKILFLIIFILIIILNLKKKETFENSRLSINNFKFFFINLDNDLLKRKNFLNNCQNINLNNIKRFNAINGKLLNYKQKYILVQNKYITNNFLKNMKSGQLGCAVSHLKILENNINSKSHIIIFEDDAILNYNFKKDLSIFLKHIPKDWDMFYLYINDFYLNNFQKKNGNRQRIKVNKYIYKPIYPLGTICYGINKNSIPKILKLLKPLDKFPIDNQLASLINKGEIKAYTTPINIVKHPIIYYSNTHEKNMYRKKI